MKFKKVFVIIMIAAILFILGCSDMINPELSGKKNPLDPPRTELLNIPSPNMAAPTSQLYESVQYIGWNGISDNSIVQGYYYQITTVYMETGEVFEQERVYTELDRKLIVFPSREKVNKQTISIFAEDKDGNLDPVGDTLEIYTRQSVPPETEIEFPAWGDTLLVKEAIDYTWAGIKIVVSDSQPNPNLYANPPEVMDYLYKIDNGEWSEPKPDSVFFLDPAIIQGGVEGPHTIYVKARNTAYKADTTAAEIDVYFYLPKHDEQEWLVIDDTHDSRFGVTDAKQDEYFQAVFDNEVESYGMWDYVTQGVVTVKEISKNKNVLYHCEHEQNTHLNEFIPVLWQYLQTGGNLFITSKVVLDNLERAEIIEELKYYGDFTKEILHINGYYDNVPNKMQGATFVSNGDSAHVDVAKISAVIGGIKDVTYINGLGNFSEPVFKYTTTDTSALGWNGRTIGTGYYNDTYRVVFCGFPLYPFTVESGKAILKETIKYFEEDKPF